MRDVPGRPALFGTTPEFLSYFNLESLKDLPSLMEQRELGQIAGEMETPLPPEVLAALENSEKDNEVETGDVSEKDSEEAGEVAETESESGVGIDQVEVAEEQQADAQEQAQDEDEEDSEEEQVDGSNDSASENEIAVKESDEEEVLSLASKGSEAGSMS